MNRKKDVEEKTNKLIKKLIDVVNEDGISLHDLPSAIAGFLYSIGHSIESDPPKTEEQLLMRYAEKPTLGTALMAQALFMKETWQVKNEREKNDKGIQRKTKRRKVASPI